MGGSTMLLGCALAWADSFKVPDDYDTLELALLAAALHSGSDTIEVLAPYVGADQAATSVDSADVRIECKDGTSLPPLFGKSATLDIDACGLAYATELCRSYVGGAYAICLDSSSLRLTDVTMSGFDGGAIGLSESDLAATGVTLRATTGYPAISVTNKGTAHTIALTDTSISSTRDGALVFDGGSGGLTVDLSGVTLAANTGGSRGTAIDAEETVLTMGASSSITDTNATAEPIYLLNSTATFTGGDFTGNTGPEAALLYGAENSVVTFTGSTIKANTSTYGAEIGARSVTLDGVAWTPGGLIYGSGGPVVIEGGTTVHIGSVALDWLIFAASGSDVTFRGAKVCGSGTRAFSTLVSLQGGDFTMSGTSVLSVAMTNLVTTESGGTVTLVDDTFVSSGTRYLSTSTLAEFTMTNVLFDRSAAQLASAATFTVDYNQYVDVPFGRSDFGSGNDGNSNDVAPPGFVDVYDPVSCSDPELAPGAWAIDHGDPGLWVDDGCSDVGSIDYTGTDGPCGGGLDSGDTGTVDTGDTGTGDTGDSGDSGGSVDESDDPDLDGDGFGADEDCNDDDAAVFPGATDTPDDGVDQDCTGSDLSVRYAGGCGCTSTTPSAAAFAPLTTLLLLRRRARS